MHLGSEPVFDNRELALLIWVGIALGWALTRRDVRSSLRDLAKLLASPKIAVSLTCLVLYVALTVASLWRAGVWTIELTSETLFWFVGTAMVLFVSFDRVSGDPRFFRRAAVGVVSITVLFEFVSNLHTFNLVVELVLVPALVTLGGLLAVSQMQPESQQVRGCLQRLVGTVGLGLVAYSAIEAIRDPASFTTATNAREFAVPVVMTLCLLPFLYAFAVFGSYDSLLTRLRFQLGDERRLYSYTRSRLFRTTGIRLRAVVRAERAAWWSLLSRPPSRAEIDHTLAHIKRKLRPALATSLKAEERLDEIVTTQAPGWEYVLFAARLDAGATAAATSSAFDDQGRAFARPLATPASVAKLLQRDQHQSVELVERFEKVFDHDRVDKALGPPGTRGDASLITDLAEDLIVIYSDMLNWRQRAKATKTTERFTELVRIHAELLDQPIQQVDDYIDRWNEFADQLPDLIARNEDATEPISVDMSLVLTVDDDVLARLRAESDRLG